MNGQQMYEVEQKKARLYLRNIYLYEIFELVITNMEVNRQDIMDYKLICASLYPSLILYSIAKDPYLKRDI
jgi:hypothetical protein